MARSKQNKQNKKKETVDGKTYRRETREERLERLRLQEEAREKCFKSLPYAGGVIVFFLFLFAMYVRSVPPKQPVPKVNVDIPLQSFPDDDPMLKQALQEAQEALMAAKEEDSVGGGGGEANTADAPGETIEL